MNLRRALSLTLSVSFDASVERIMRDQFWVTRTRAERDAIVVRLPQSNAPHAT